MGALPPQRNKSPAHRPTVRMIAIQSPQEDIGVEKAKHMQTLPIYGNGLQVLRAELFYGGELTPLVFASVDAIPADRLV